MKKERKLKQCLGTGQAETFLACESISDTHCKYTQILSDPICIICRDVSTLTDSHA